MKKYNVIDKKTGNLLLSFITYDKKIENLFLTQFKKIRQVNVCEAK